MIGKNAKIEDILPIFSHDFAGKNGSHNVRVHVGITLAGITIY